MLNYFDIGLLLFVVGLGFKSAVTLGGSWDAVIILLLLWGGAPDVGTTITPPDGVTICNEELPALGLFSSLEVEVVQVGCWLEVVLLWGAAGGDVDEIVVLEIVWVIVDTWIRWLCEPGLVTITAGRLELKICWVGTVRFAVVVATALGCAKPLK